LAKELKGFFFRSGTGDLLSMDDNGLAGYELYYSIPSSFSPTGDNQNHQVYIEKANADSKDGNIRVTTITTVPDGEKLNTAAIDKTPIVRIDLRAPGSNTNIATRYFKLHIGRDAVAPIDVTGMLNLQVQASGDDGFVAFNNPLNLDHAYNRLGLSTADFHAKYTWDPTSVTVNGTPIDPTEFTVTPVTVPTTENRFHVAIANTVMPGTYTIRGQYGTGVSADEVVNVIITVTVGDSYIGKLAPKSAFWDAQFTHGIINGRQEGTE